MVYGFLNEGKEPVLVEKVILEEIKEEGNVEEVTEKVGEETGKAVEETGKAKKEVTDTTSERHGGGRQVG